MSNWYKFVLNNPVPATTLMSTQCFFHVGATWGVLEALGKGNIWNHVSDDIHYHYCRIFIHVCKCSYMPLDLVFFIQ